MKRLSITFLFLLPLLMIAGAQAPMQYGPFMARAAVSSPAYIVNETCEGTGTPSGWTDANAPNWDYTTTALQGSQSLNLTASSISSYKTFTDASSLDVYFLFRTDTLPGSASSMAALRTSADSALCIFRVNATGQVTVFANGADSTACATTMSINTTYHVWLTWNASGTCSVAFSTDGVRPTSGNQFTSKTGGSGNAGRLRFGTGASGVTIYDRILVLAGTIGNNP